MNGLLVIDKPAGITSHDVVHKVRRITGEQSIGHLGTLDPMATGVLPLLLGKWTRLAQFFGKLEKSYTGSIRFGFATDTYDAEGEMVGERVPAEAEADEIVCMAQSFVGTIEQTPPIYSAKKVDGKAAYALARAGRSPVMRAVPVTVHRFIISRASTMSVLILKRPCQLAAMFVLLRTTSARSSAAALTWQAFGAYRRAASRSSRH